MKSPHWANGQASLLEQIWEKSSSFPLSSSFAREPAGFCRKQVTPTVISWTCHCEWQICQPGCRSLVAWGGTLEGKSLPEIKQGSLHPVDMLYTVHRVLQNGWPAVQLGTSLTDKALVMYCLSEKSLFSSRRETRVLSVILKYGKGCGLGLELKIQGGHWDMSKQG